MPVLSHCWIKSSLISIHLSQFLASDIHPSSKEFRSSRLLRLGLPLRRKHLNRSMYMKIRSELLAQYPVRYADDYTKNIELDKLKAQLF